MKYEIQREKIVQLHMQIGVASIHPSKESEKGTQKKKSLKVVNGIC